VLAIALLCVSAAHAAPWKQDMVIFRDPAKYACFPGLIRGEGDKLWVSFGWNTTRSHYRAAAGGETGSERFFSPGGGRRWIDEGDAGFEAPPALTGYFRLSGAVLALANGQGHETMTQEETEKLKGRGINVVDHHNGNFTAAYRIWMRRSTDDGKTWEQRYLDLPPLQYIFPGFGNPTNGCCDDETLLIPQYGQLARDVVDRAFVLRSTDEGQTWQLISIAYDGVHPFNEASLINVGGGRVFAHMRCEPNVRWPNTWEGGFVYQVDSGDNGAAWSAPRRLPIWGYPQTLLKLRDGTILSSYGYRRPPYGVRACFSRDGGRTWDWKHEVILRTDGLTGGPEPPKGHPGDLGYPYTTELADGSLFTVYYFTLGDGVTHIAATRWSRDYRGPDLPRGEDAIRRPDPKLPPECIVGEERPLQFDASIMQSFVPTMSRIAMVAVRFSGKSREATHVNGLFMVIRRPDGTTWWTEPLGTSETLTPDRIPMGGWVAFRFPEPVEVVPGEFYALTIYNRDFTGGPSPKLQEGLTGDHGWYLNSVGPGPREYPNGSVGATSGDDVAFRVYAEEGALPRER
jgi:BNR repeat-like domain